MIHIVHVINSVDLRSGGPVYALRALVTEQIRRGYRISVVTTDMQAGMGGKSREEYTTNVLHDKLWESVNFELVASFGRGRPWNHLGFAPSARGMLKKLVRHEKPDLVHVHGVFGWITGVACSVCRWAGIPYVLEPYGAYDPRCLWSHLWPLKLAYHAAFGRRELIESSAIKVASEFEAQPFRQWKHCTQKVWVIPYGVDVIGTSSPGDASNSLTVCFISRIAKKKRPEWVVQACQKLRSEFPGLKVVIAGSDDGHRSFLRNFVQKTNASGWVQIVDFVEGAAKQQLLSSARVLVLPSRDESLGAVVLEAMAAGTPVVVTPGVASHIYLDAAGCGFTVDDSVDAVAEGIRRVLLSDRTQLGRRGKEYVEKHLTWPAVVDKLDELYQSILQK